MRLVIIELMISVLLIAVVCGSAWAAERPNIIFIMTDDLNTQVLRDGSTVRVPTPNIDRLRARGVSFMNAHAVSPICGPSRAGTLCGYYPQTSGYWGWKQQQSHWRTHVLLKRSPTVFEHARDNGYLVAGGGKVFHNGHHDKSVFMDGDKYTFGPGDSHGPWPLQAAGPAWKFWCSHPDFEGLGQFGFYTPLSNVPQVPADPEKNVAGYAGWGDHSGPFYYNGRDDHQVMPDVKLAKWAAKWLDEASTERPFLLCVGFNRPHSPWVVPDEYFERFPLEAVHVVPTIADDTADNAPELQAPKPDTWLKSGLSKHKKIINRDGDVRKWTQAYMACVSFVDDQLGVVLDAVDNSEHAENTIIIFTSDHGYHMGEKQRIFKNTLWEPSTSVPLIVSGPGIVPEKRSQQPVSLIDIYQTIVEAASLPHKSIAISGAVDLALPPLDGLSLMQLCKDTTLPRNRTSVLSNVPAKARPDADPKTAIPKQHWSLRSEHFRYIRANAGGEELYDMRSDKYEWHNLAADPNYAEIKTAFKKELHKPLGL